MKKTILAAILTVLSAAHVFAFDMSAMTDAERQTFRDEVRAYLLDNPEVLIEAITVLEQKQAQQVAMSDQELVRTNAQEIFNDGYSWVGGNPDGDITIVEFLDYRCSFCRKAHPEVMQLLELDGNIRFVVKEFPILGDQSVLASKFAVSVLMNSGPEAYAAVLDELMTFRGEIADSSLRRIASELDLNVGAVMNGMDHPAIEGMIASNRQLAQVLQITGTPGFVIGNQIIRGYAPLADMQTLVHALRSQ